ncbi:MAG: polymer-forming cytoskeletal protein [bacterium]
MKHWHKISLLIAVFLLIPTITLAATIKSGNTYTLAADQTLDGSLYVGAGIINVNGTVNGDVVVGGGTVTISGTVNGDILASGGTVSVTGTVTEDVRVAGGQITLSTHVPGDVNAIGGSITIEDSAVVEGDLLSAGGDINLNGTVNGEIRVAGGDLVIAGTVQGDVLAYVGQLTVGGSAVLGSDLTYSSSHEARIDGGSSIAGEVTFDKTAYHLTLGLLGATIIGWLIKFVAMIVAAVVLATLLRKYTKQTVEIGRTQFWKQLLIGLGGLIATPIVIAILMTTMIGGILGAILIPLYLLMLILAAVYAGIIFGAWGFRYLNKNHPVNGNWLSALVGVLALQLISLIPVVGWIIGFGFFVVALGSLSTHKWQVIRN